MAVFQKIPDAQQVCARGQNTVHLEHINYHDCTFAPHPVGILSDIIRYTFALVSKELGVHIQYLWWTFLPTKVLHVTLKSSMLLVIAVCTFSSNSE